MLQGDPHTATRGLQDRHLNNLQNLVINDLAHLALLFLIRLMNYLNHHLGLLGQLDSHQLTKNHIATKEGQDILDIPQWYNWRRANKH